MVTAELERIRTLVHARAKEIFAMKIEEVAGIGSTAQAFLRDIQNAAIGGNAIRAALVCYGAVSCSGQVTPATIDLAVFMELFHAFLLLHDDIIDQDDMRRGKPSFHALYRDQRSQAYQPSYPNHFGHSMAIIAGDVLCGLAYDVLARAALPPEAKQRIFYQANRMLFETGLGEMLDVLNTMHRQASRAHLLKVHLLKTSRYSFAGPLAIGAIAAGGGQAQLSALEQYALPLGITYQIWDDIAGMFGTSEKIGKPVHSDLKQGKLTLHIIEAYQRCTPNQAKVLDRALGNHEVTAEQIEQVKTIVIETGARDYAMRLAKQFQSTAVSSLKEPFLHPSGVDFLRELAEYVTQREY